MTGLIAIDESGDLGSSGSRYFCIAAIVMLRTRDLKKASSLLAKDCEGKWYNTFPEKRIGIMEALAESNLKVVYAAVDKNHPGDNHPVYGNELYEKVLKQVISDAMSILPCRDVNVFLDSSGFVSIDRFRKIVLEQSVIHDVNPIKIDKVHSEQNKCIQLVDYVAGASRAKYERSDDTLDIMLEKVSVARRL